GKKGFISATPFSYGKWWIIPIEANMGLNLLDLSNFKETDIVCAKIAIINLENLEITTPSGQFLKNRKIGNMEYRLCTAFGAKFGPHISGKILKVEKRMNKEIIDVLIGCQDLVFFAAIPENTKVSVGDLITTSCRFEILDIKKRNDCDVP
ncbi:hypothetical protein HYU18_04185, partial [Candidatus Woesearchaeota archaeon]|nr:hypothetical protein [Candidatus Woesearchaeota archaeon]